MLVLPIAIRQFADQVRPPGMAWEAPECPRSGSNPRIEEEGIPAFRSLEAILGLCAERAPIFGPDCSPTYLDRIERRADDGVSDLKFMPVSRPRDRLSAPSLRLPRLLDAPDQFRR
jgi:hypothetical protein